MDITTMICAVPSTWQCLAPRGKAGNRKHSRESAWGASEPNPRLGNEQRVRRLGPSVLASPLDTLPYGNGWQGVWRRTQLHSIVVRNQRTRWLMASRSNQELLEL